MERKKRKENLSMIIHSIYSYHFIISILTG